jgi:hypothetical protein
MVVGVHVGIGHMAVEIGAGGGVGDNHRVGAVAGTDRTVVEVAAADILHTLAEGAEAAADIDA